MYLFTGDIFKLFYETVQDNSSMRITLRRGMRSVLEREVGEKQFEKLLERFKPVQGGYYPLK